MFAVPQYKQNIILKQIKLVRLEMTIVGIPSKNQIHPYRQRGLQAPAKHCTIEDSGACLVTELVSDFTPVVSVQTQVKIRVF